MEIKIIDKLTKSDKCYISFGVFNEDEELILVYDKVLNNDDFLETNIEIEKIKTLDNYLNRDKKETPNILFAYIEEYNGSSKISCSVIHYDLLGNNCLVSYELSNDYDVLFTGTWKVDDETMEIWGSDDMVILYGLINYLNLKIK